MALLFEALPVWRNEEISGRLDWYFDVATNRKPAKYLICRRIPCELDLGASSEKELWLEHERLSGEFLDAYRAVRRGEASLRDLPQPQASLLDLKVALVKRILARCTFCRWNCRVDRAHTTRHGTCQLESTSRVGSYFHHRGEELPIRGTQGSGTIFFTSCNMRCSFCQNGDISHDKLNGIEVSPRLLALMMWQLRAEGCHNVNLVGGEPTIHLHNIVEAISLLGRVKPTPAELRYVEGAKADASLYWKPNPARFHYEGEFNVPILWNSNFFMSLETMRILRELVDIWLPDFKFGNDRCAVRLSKTPWYFETVTRNHELVYGWGEDLVVRHLVMPNHVECCTRPVLEWIARHCPEAPVNIMDQFHPDYACDPCSPAFDRRYSELARFPNSEEIRRAYRYAKELGLRFEEITFEKKMTPFW